MENRPARYRFSLSVLLTLCFVMPLVARAEWTVANLSDVDDTEQTQVAYTENSEGYSLEIYRDSSNVVRGRFTLAGDLLEFVEDSCPTYQIDRGMPTNRSINNASCLSSDKWAEFILGYIDNKHIASSSLLAIMNGINIVFRFRLQNGDYRSTSFSLQGSKRALTAVLGGEITVGSN